MLPTGSRPDTDDFRLYLQRELTKRCQKNAKYSLRSFAKLLGLDSSRLSKILRGERPVTLKLIPQLGQRLGLSQKEILRFCVAAKARRHQSFLQNAPQASFQALPLEVFESIEDWRHYAILELMKVQGFEGNAKWIAKALRITVSEAHAYIERLERVGLLEIRADGSWHDRSDGFSTHVLSENETTYAHRRAQKKILELASEALDATPIEARDQSSMMMAINPEKMAEAKRMIQKFRRELCELLEDSETKESVYQLSISLFPLVENKSR